MASTICCPITNSFFNHELNTKLPFVLLLLLMDKYGDGTSADSCSDCNMEDIVTDEPPCKKPRSSTSCIIHYEGEDMESHLVQPNSFESWEALLKAAQIRNHKPLLEFAKSTYEIPNIFYHRKCRCRFTIKRELQSLQSSKTEEGSHACVENRRSNRQSPTSSRVYEKQCLFCRKVKYKKGQKSRELLIQCVDLRADRRVRDMAIKKQDVAVLSFVARDIVAAEAHYHRSCYKKYTRAPDCTPCSIPEVDEHDIQYQEAEADAYFHLFSYIRNTLFSNPKTVKMVDLTTVLVDHMKMAGISNIRESTKKHIRRKLEAEFCQAIHIFPDDKGKLLVIPDNLSIYELAKENIKLTDDIHSKQSQSSEDKGVITSAAILLRSRIKEQDDVLEWPHLPESLNIAAIKLPLSLKQFLFGLLTGDISPKQPSERVTWLVNSFGQDLLYAVSCGKQKPPKHILLPAVVKNLTGNAELIQALNRLGHGVSYSQLEENETALCLQKMASSVDGDVVLPSTAQPHVFTTMAWDNIDILEETLTGEGTSHRVNGIIVQPRMHGPHEEKPQLPIVEKKKQRSIPDGEFALPVYNTGERCGPGQLTTTDSNRDDTLHQALRKDVLWFLTRQTDSPQQTIGSWTGFNISVRQDLDVCQDNIGYLPTINAPATSLATCFEILNQAKNIMGNLHLKKVVIVFDQAMFAKVAEVIWKRKDHYPGIILRLGTFHTICNVLSILGKRFQDAGLRDLCIESGIVAEGSLGAVMEGRQYNRAVRVHKYVLEAMMRIAWKGFVPWLRETQAGEVCNLEETQELITELQDNVCQKQFDEVLENTSFIATVKAFQSYLDFLRNDNGPLSSYWMSYIDMVQKILLGLIRASREGNWELHLAAVRAMIPWCFAYDKVNYARYLPVYYANMTMLPTQHPDVYEQFQHGRFSVQLSQDNPFGKIPVDQATEETVNKDTKVPGGIRKYSLKAGAVTRFYLTAEYRSAFLRQFRDMLGLNRCDLHHAELQSPRMLKDEQAVKTVVDTIENWINPFDGYQEIVSLSTATAATTEIANDLLRAEKVGENAYKRFREERLDNESPTIKFHDKLPQHKLQTFTNMSKKKTKVNSCGKDIILVAERKLFAQMILIAQARKELQMKTVLCYPLGPLPWSLSTPDGKPRKTNKAVLARELQKRASVAENIPQPSTTIIDGMALVQKMKGDQKTFGQVATLILSSALREGAHSSRIDIVFDVYQHHSIKEAERLNRCQDNGVQYKNIASAHVVRQWRNFLSSTDNKTSLIEFLVTEWKHPTSRELLAEKELFVTNEEKCYRITKDDTQEVLELESSHEEADTRLLLHAAHAADNHTSAVVIASEDTDVFLLCLAFSDSIHVPLYQKCGNITRTRFIDVGKVARAVGMDVCKGILGLHAFTGCDSVSAFAGRGKIRALRTLENDKAAQDVFKELGQEWTLSSTLFSKLETYTCQLYGSRMPSMRVNDFRYHLFYSKKGAIESHQMPPCKDALQKHAERANYQAAVWKRSLQQKPEVPSPDGFGWRIECAPEGGEKLVIDWMDGAPAPEAVLEFLACKCSRSCKLPSCPCMVNRMKCSSMCKLKMCENQEDEVDTGTDVSSEDEFDEVDF